MKKILILSYFFPPANFAASYRVASWAKFFYQFGYYPIIVTRQWNKDQNNAFDKVTNNVTQVVKYDTYEVHYVQVENTFRENLVHRFPFLFGASRPLVLLELMLKGFSWTFHPSAYLYRYLREYLKGHHDVHRLIVTGNPFDLFKAGYDLSREFGIKWIADYRDGWTSWEVYRKEFLFNLLRRIDEPLEKKWLSNVSFFTTVNDDLVKGIANLTGKKGYKIMNGFNPDDYNNSGAAISVPMNPDALKMVYNGTMYKTQNLIVFFDGIRSYLKSNPGAQIQIFFPGILSDPSQSDRIQEVAGAELLPYITLTQRLPKAEIIALQKASDLMLFFTHEGFLKGTFPSKMFEYFGISKPILVCPNDNGRVEELINETRTGYIAKDAEDVADFLKKFKAGQYRFEPNVAEIQKYTREKQCQKLAETIDQNND